ncbi:hypothetical protein RB614_27760 [Phytohabitans sp. ZYX-F-186]|uniref:DUF4399 domain-containing protein n=1 Tax=Phytohabitans maris TaxID=3071409 RepID=A0ABU0ZMS1_9ACTN|nr:hypothetical protein [Phytohabitans sp. ZYX-F-186]MDQ7908329.1 hypothetical protein [Phytohabitans sp. ZYX-F-186]
MRASTMMWTRGAAAAAVLLLAAGGLAACGGDEGTDSGGSGSGGGMTLTVLEPAAGADVAVPFTVKVDSSVPLGPSESGRHHVHIWFDGDEENYLIVESDTTQVAAAPTGEHVMHVSLRNANHSAAGVEATTRLVVAEGGDMPSGPGDGY